MAVIGQLSGNTIVNVIIADPADYPDDLNLDNTTHIGIGWTYNAEEGFFENDDKTLKVIQDPWRVIDVAAGEE